MAQRAKLKIFLGYAPGVGKTFKMLQLAAELVLQKVDLVVGYVDTHGRYDTGALLLGLEILPRRKVLLDDGEREELDLEGALARRPAVILIDDLAHTNVAGVRHGKRWQDVLDLLDAGIDVHTTLNIQHLESLIDVVAQITTVPVRETVPDSLLERADEIELVDVPPDELLARLRAGKVHLPDTATQAAARATEQLFQRGNLLALRELALRRATEHVDADVQEYRAEHEIRTTWAAAERILVCVGPSPASARLIRAGRRMAAGLRAPWAAVHVDAVGGTMSAEDRRTLESHLRLAESLGGEVVRLAAPRPSEAILDYARRHNVTHLVAGKPTHSRLRDLLGGSLLDEIVRGSGDIDVHVISGDMGPPRVEPPAARAGEGRPRPAAWAWAVVVIAITSALAASARALIGLPDPEMLYLLAIMVTAVWLGRGPSVLAAALSVAAYDFLFVAPRHTFTVEDWRYLLTFAMMFSVGLLISTLTIRLRRQGRDAAARAERTAALYTVSRDLGAALDTAEIAQVGARHAAEAVGARALVLLRDEHGELAPRGAAPAGTTLDAADASVARWVLDHGRAAGLGTSTSPEARCLCLPLRTGPDTIGVLAAIPATGPPATPSPPAPIGPEPVSFLEALARQVASAAARARLAEEAKIVALRARTEELRSALLSAVSHDLRTPLATITGTATTLRDEPALPAATRAELLESLCAEAERLERLVSNLLEMTRLQSGAAHVKREWVPVEELVGSALNRLEAQLAGRAIATHVPADLPLVPVDPVLIEQVLINLIDNVTKYTPAGTPFDIDARALPQAVELTLADRGPGFTGGEEARVFERFYRGGHPGVGGAGLGLAICRGIVEAHGGTISAENRPGGGAVFRILLPLVGTPPAPPPREDDERLEGQHGQHG